MCIRDSAWTFGEESASPAADPIPRPPAAVPIPAVANERRISCVLLPVAGNRLFNFIASFKTVTLSAIGMPVASSTYRSAFF